MANKLVRPKYTFEEAWRFLYRYGTIYLQLNDGPLVEVKTGVTKTDTGLKNIIRFLEDKDEVLRIFGRCWDTHEDCEEEIDGYRDALISYIDTAYIE
ncbi:MAG: hypothetical protein NWF07_08030 [Candidatus Bathyarchaeota archaeon]|nr:hypothetical protein [Candidatus Bathyarchaeota archaeon]